MAPLAPEHHERRSEHTDATEDRPDDYGDERSREDLDKLGDGSGEDVGPQPWAKNVARRAD